VGHDGFERSFGDHILFGGPSASRPGGLALHWAVLTDFARQLHIEQMKFAVQTNGVVAAPAAGAIYWFALFVLGRYMSPYNWCLIAFIASGLMFPLALLLQKPTRSNMMVKDNPLTGASLAAFINIAVAWPITIAAFHTAIALVPLALAIGMSLHLATVGWSLGLRSYLVHPIVRAIAVTALWYALPAHRFTAIPLAVSAIYLVTIPCVLREVAMARELLKLRM
jgi:hypothetical protein